MYMFYVPVKLFSAEGNLHLFSEPGQVVAENVIYKKNILWDVLEINSANVRLQLDDKVQI